MDFPVLAVYTDNSIKVVWMPPGIRQYGYGVMCGMTDWFMQQYVHYQPVKCAGIILSKEYDLDWYVRFDEAARGYATVYAPLYTNVNAPLDETFNRFLQDSLEIDPVMCKMAYVNLGLVNV